MSGRGHGQSRSHGDNHRPPHSPDSVPPRKHLTSTAPRRRANGFPHPPSAGGVAAPLSGSAFPASASGSSLSELSRFTESYQPPSPSKPPIGYNKLEIDVDEEFWARLGWRLIVKFDQPLTEAPPVSPDELKLWQRHHRDQQGKQRDKMLRTSELILRGYSVAGNSEPLEGDPLFSEATNLFDDTHFDYPIVDGEIPAQLLRFKGRPPQEIREPILAALRRDADLRASGTPESEIDGPALVNLMALNQWTHGVIKNWRKEYEINNYYLANQNLQAHYAGRSLRLRDRRLKDYSKFWQAAEAATEAYGEQGKLFTKKYNLNSISAKVENRFCIANVIEATLSSSKCGIGVFGFMMSATEYLLGAANLPAALGIAAIASIPSAVFYYESMQRVTLNIYEGYKNGKSKYSEMMVNFDTESPRYFEDSRFESNSRKIAYYTLGIGYMLGVTGMVILGFPALSSATPWLNYMLWGAKAIVWASIGWMGLTLGTDKSRKVIDSLWDGWEEFTSRRNAADLLELKLQKCSAKHLEIAYKTLHHKIHNQLAWSHEQIARYIASIRADISIRSARDKHSSLRDVIDFNGAMINCIQTFLNSPFLSGDDLEQLQRELQGLTPETQANSSAEELAAPPYPGPARIINTRNSIKTPNRPGSSLRTHLLSQPSEYVDVELGEARLEELPTHENPLNDTRCNRSLTVSQVYLGTRFWTEIFVRTLSIGISAFACVSNVAGANHMLTTLIPFMPPFLSYSLAVFLTIAPFSLNLDSADPLLDKLLLAKCWDYHKLSFTIGNKAKTDKCAAFWAALLTCLQGFNGFYYAAIGAPLFKAAILNWAGGVDTAAFMVVTKLPSMYRKMVSLNQWLAEKCSKSEPAESAPRTNKNLCDWQDEMLQLLGGGIPNVLKQLRQKIDPTNEVFTLTDWLRSWFTISGDRQALFGLTKPEIEGENGFAIKTKTAIDTMVNEAEESAQYAKSLPPNHPEIAERIESLQNLRANIMDYLHNKLDGLKTHFECTLEKTEATVRKRGDYQKATVDNETGMNGMPNCLPIRAYQQAITLGFGTVSSEAPQLAN